MKKNGQYVGVDEKYIPEEEKYVDNSVNNEIKGLVNDGIKSAKEYVSDKDNQEKIKNTGKKGLKILKGVGIGYLVFIGFVVLMVIVIFAITFGSFFKISREVDDTFDETIHIIDKVIDNIEEDEAGYSSYDIASFNNSLESHQGTKSGSIVSILLDEVVTKIKKNSDHSITVIYGTKKISNPTDIIALKKEFDSTKKYEISFDYDADGFINKVTIENY